MTTTTGRLGLACALVIELAVLGYGTLMAWLLSAWFLDDAVAAGMQPTDWWSIAAERFVSCALVSVFAATCVSVVNRWLARVNQWSGRWPLVTTALFVVLPVGASLAGVIQFGLTKPFM